MTVFYRHFFKSLLLATAVEFILIVVTILGTLLTGVHGDDAELWWWLQFPSNVALESLPQLNGTSIRLAVLFCCQVVLISLLINLAGWIRQHRQPERK